VLGDLRLRAGAVSDAEPLYRQALAIQVKAFPAGHVEAATTRSGIGACLIELGRYEAAEPLLLESLADLQRGVGRQETAQATLRRIIDLYGRWGKPQRAEPYRVQLRD
jgi:hypothetical protein